MLSSLNAAPLQKTNEPFARLVRKASSSPSSACRSNKKTPSLGPPPGLSLASGCLIRNGVRSPRLGEPLEPQQTRITPPARPALGIRVVAAARPTVVHAQLQTAAD